MNYFDVAPWSLALYCAPSSIESQICRLTCAAVIKMYSLLGVNLGITMLVFANIPAAVLSLEPEGFAAHC
jgi:hypothetical protein